MNSSSVIASVLVIVETALRMLEAATLAREVRTVLFIRLSCWRMLPSCERNWLSRLPRRKRLMKSRTAGLLRGSTGSGICMAQETGSAQPPTVYLPRTFVATCMAS